MTIKRIKPLTANIGIVGVGHHLYWDQFDGLLEEMHRKIKVLETKLQARKATTYNFGMIDQAEAAYGIVKNIKAADLDLLMIDMVTYATSSTFGVLARKLNIPIVLVALQPMKAMDYKNGHTFMQLVNDDFCAVPEFTGVAVRMGRRPPPVILGYEEGDEIAEAQLTQWCRIAQALHDLKRARIGLMGHVLDAMLDMHTDPTAITAAFGCHVPVIEPHDLLRHFRSCNEAEIKAKRKEITGFFDTPDPQSDPLTEKLTEEDLETAARGAVALDGLIKEKSLDGLAYYYEADEGSETRKLMTNLIVGNSLLTGAGFPMCGEFDLKTCIAMVIMDRLEVGGSFAEFHPIDFEQNTVLVGHDGPHHINIADGKPVIRSLKKYHGKPGSGASVEFRIKEGPITMLGLGQNADGSFKFIVAEGMSESRPIPPTGNTNTHGRFGQDIRRFLCNWAAQGPTHHFALGIGHHTETICMLADCLNIKTSVVTG